MQPRPIESRDRERDGMSRSWNEGLDRAGDSTSGGFVRISENTFGEMEMKKRLAFFFMDPLQKYKARGQIPWKLIIQFLKIIFVTSQLVILGNYRFSYDEYYNDNKEAIEELFMKGWEKVEKIKTEIDEDTEMFAIFDKPTFYEYFDHIAHTFSDLEKLAVNPAFPTGDLEYCYEKFSDGKVFSDLTWNIDFKKLEEEEKCTKIPSSDIKAESFHSVDYLPKHNIDVPWHTVMNMVIKFKISAVTYLEMGPSYGPECFEFEVEIEFENENYDGRMPVDVEVEPKRIKCPKPVKFSDSISTFVRLLNYLVMILCSISLVLCLRALVRAQKLRIKAEKFFSSNFGWKLTSSEKFDFLNGWYIVICINDILIIIGSVVKEYIDTNRTDREVWDVCSVFLGFGNVLVWIGMLRYLEYFQDYNILIVTMKGALPNCIRFLICTSLVYIGFVFCGWIILGPYVKERFGTMVSTSECLFALTNGDDVFQALQDVPQDPYTIWVISRIYMFTFMVLFIFVVLNLFIAIIMDVYDAIQEYKTGGWPKGRLKEFYLAEQTNIQRGEFGSGAGLWTFIVAAFGWLRNLRQSRRERQSGYSEIQ